MFPFCFICRTSSFNFNNIISLTRWPWRRKTWKPDKISHNYILAKSCLFISHFEFRAILSCVFSHLWISRYINCIICIVCDWNDNVYFLSIFFLFGSFNKHHCQDITSFLSVVSFFGKKKLFQFLATVVQFCWLYNKKKYIQYSDSWYYAWIMLWTCLVFCCAFRLLNFK